MISYNTDLVQGVMKVLDDAGLLDLSVPEIIKLVEEKFPSTNSDYAQCAHEWVLIEGNPVVKDMDICVKCHLVRAHSA